MFIHYMYVYFINILTIPKVRYHSPYPSDNFRDIPSSLPDRKEVLDTLENPYNPTNEEHQGTSDTQEASDTQELRDFMSNIKKGGSVQPDNTELPEQKYEPLNSITNYTLF